MVNVHVDFSQDVHEVEIELACETPAGRIARLKLPAFWVTFHFFNPHGDIDLNFIEPREWLLRQHIAHSPASDKLLRNRFSNILAHAKPEFHSAKARLERKRYRNFSVILGTMSDAMRNPAAKSAGKCVSYDFDLFDKRTDSGAVIKDMIDVFHALNDPLMAGMLTAWESVKASKFNTLANCWNRGLQRDGTPFGYTFSRFMGRLVIITNGIFLDSDTKRMTVRPEYSPAMAASIVADNLAVEDFDHQVTSPVMITTSVGAHNSIRYVDADLEIDKPMREAILARAARVPAHLDFPVTP